MNDLQELTAIMEHLEGAGSFKHAAERLTCWARHLTGCESAILRLIRQDGETPWLATCVVDGAPADFARDEMVLHGADCICGRVATGDVDPDLPFYTPEGSFTWGRLSTLSRDFTPEELGPLRGRCMEELFESVAVVPLRAGGRIVGSLHLADRRTDWFHTYLQVLEAACRLAGATLLRHKSREREEAILQSIESALMPAAPPTVDGLEIGVSFTSATEMAHVGGDFYDVLDLGEAGALVLVGDVSGKGVSAAGMAAQARYAIEAEANLVPDPASFLEAANNSLTRVLPTERFVAAAACLVDRGSGSMLACLAGHPAPLVIAPSGTVEIDAPHNPPLGLTVGRRYAEVKRRLSPGEILLVYTDGVSEARNDNALFGNDGVIGAAESLTEQDPASIARRVCSAAAEFHDPDLPSDDRLVVAVRVRKEDGGGDDAAG